MPKTNYKSEDYVSKKTIMNYLYFYFLIMEGMGAKEIDSQALLNLSMIHPDGHILVPSKSKEPFKKQMQIAEMAMNAIMKGEDPFLKYNSDTNMVCMVKPQDNDSSEKKESSKKVHSKKEKCKKDMDNSTIKNSPSIERLLKTICMNIDDSNIDELARILNYYPERLKDDIAALKAEMISEK